MTSGFSHTVAQWSGVRLRERKMGRVSSLMTVNYTPSCLLAFEHVLNRLVPRPFHHPAF